MKQFDLNMREKKIGKVYRRFPEHFTWKITFSLLPTSVCINLNDFLVIIQEVTE